MEATPISHCHPLRKIHSKSRATASRGLALTLAITVGCGVPAGCRAEAPGRTAAKPGLWIGQTELAALPTAGPAWERLTTAARRPATHPTVGDQDDPTNTIVLAKALVAARTGDAALRGEVIAAVQAVIGTEKSARTLAVGRKVITYVLAADLVALPADVQERFRAWLRALLDAELDGLTLRTTHERRPNNWGTHAGASRLAIALYLGMNDEVQRTARVFRGWLGDRSAYDAFRYGDLDWQADPKAPVGINPKGATRGGHSIDGVLADDQRRAGTFTWPPPHENYVYEALQGALVTAVLLDRAGYPDVWEWSDRALLRAYRWLYDEAGYAATGDDRWQLPIVDRVYGTSLWDGGAVTPGKNVGWTDWTLAGSAAPGQSAPKPPPSPPKSPR